MLDARGLPDEVLGLIFKHLQGDAESRRSFMHTCKTMHQSSSCRKEVSHCIGGPRRLARMHEQEQ
eukprot:scaffold50574_cov24-Tisochrysis_lutea.AAC.1